MLQARFSQSDHRLYGVHRDVAHNFPFVAKEVAQRLVDNRWPAVNAVCEKAGVSLEQLGKAAEAFCKFVMSARDRPAEDMKECLEQAGWFDVDETAQVAYMATLGCVMSGIYFAGVREASAAGDNPLLGIHGIVEAGKACAEMMTNQAKGKQRDGE